MEQLATPGSIRLTGDTLRLVEGLVQVTSLGPIPVKGMPEPVEVYELVGATPGWRRLQTPVARGLSPFVGRQTELATLCQAQERAGNGQGQVVAVIGEPGIGKSRLFYEYSHSPQTTEWLILESRAVSYGQATPYFPVIELLKTYFQIEDRDEIHTIRTKVTDQVFKLNASLQDIIPALLASWMLSRREILTSRLLLWLRSLGCAHFKLTAISVWVCCMPR